ncbi:MAG: pseudouridine synthase [Actinomycetota bacterium]
MASRRAAEDLVREGRVLVDGVPAHLGQKVDPETAKVEIDGIPLPIKPGLVHYLVYKPTGVISTADDPQGRPTVVQFVPDDTRVYPVGRLDVESEGLLIVTNDGDLTAIVTHPRHGVTKTYLARVTGHPGKSVVGQLVTGVDLDDGPASAVSARVIDRSSDSTLVEVVLGEGRNREVRRMFSALGHEVEALVRTAIGPIRDPGLLPGTWRHLSTDEVRALYGAATLPR